LDAKRTGLGVKADLGVADPYGVMRERLMTCSN
jgi:hypothetical protein